MNGLISICKMEYIYSFGITEVLDEAPELQAQMYLNKIFHFFNCFYQALKRDGELIVDYLRQELGAKKIGIHGESMGGLVATHVAKAKNLDYLCASRNFSELSKVAELTYGKIAGALYRAITLWTDDTSNDYLEANCYKIVAFDSTDEVIHPLGSLKHGIISKVLEKRLVQKEEPKKPVMKESYSVLSPLRLFASFQNFSYFIKRTAYNNSITQELESYYGLLSKDETLELYWACRRVSEIIFSLMSEAFANNVKEPVLTSSKTVKILVKEQNKEGPGSPGFDNEDDPKKQLVLAHSNSSSKTTAPSETNSVQGNSLMGSNIQKSYAHLLDKGYHNTDLDELIYQVSSYCYNFINDLNRFLLYSKDLKQGAFNS